MAGAIDYRLDVATDSSFLNYVLGYQNLERRKRDQLQRDWVKCEHDLLLPRTSLQWVRYKPKFQR